MSRKSLRRSKPAAAWRQVGAVLLALLTACATTPHMSSQEVDTYATGPGTTWYELSELPPHAPGTKPVQVSREEFRQAVAELARDIRPTSNPQQFAQRLLELEEELEFLAQVEGGQVVRMMPWGGERTSASQAEVKLAREYLLWCEKSQGGGDCLGLLVDGPTLSSRDKSTLAMAFALGAVLVVMLVMAGAAYKGPALVSRLPKLPGSQQAAVQAEAQGGVRLAQVAEVESVAASEEGLFSVLLRSRAGGRPAPASGPRPSVTTVIQHRGGNRQVVLNGQRWHLPKGRSTKDIPAQDTVGDQLQAAATQAARRWGADKLSRQEREAIQQALSEGEYWLAHLLEREARGRFVESILKDQFRHMRWSPRGVDAMDAATGLKYELLSRTSPNLARHGRRLSNDLFRMITFRGVRQCGSKLSPTRIKRSRTSGSLSTPRTPYITLVPT